MDQPNHFLQGSIVWFTEQSCHARILMVRRPVGDAPFMYDIECDDGETLQYVEEERLYPSSLPEEL